MDINIDLYIFIKILFYRTCNVFCYKNIFSFYVIKFSFYAFTASMFLELVKTSIVLNVYMLANKATPLILKSIKWAHQSGALGCFGVWEAHREAAWGNLSGNSDLRRSRALPLPGSLIWAAQTPFWKQIPCPN